MGERSQTPAAPHPRAVPPGPLRASPAESARAARRCTRRAPPRAVPSPPPARRSRADAGRRTHHLPHSTRAAPAARWCCSTDPGERGLRHRPRCAARPRTHRSSHRARAPSAAARRGRPARRRPRRRARAWRCNEIVLSVRSEMLFTNASFCRSEPTARLSSQLLFDDRIGAALQRDRPGDLAGVPIQLRDVADRRQRAPVIRTNSLLPDAQRSKKHLGRPWNITDRAIDDRQIVQERSDVDVLGADERLTNGERARRVLERRRECLALAREAAQILKIQADVVAFRPLEHLSPARAPAGSAPPLVPDPASPRRSTRGCSGRLCRPGSRSSPTFSRMAIARR